MEKISFATLLAMIVSYAATFFIHLLIILQLLRFAREQIFLWAFSRRWEISIGVVVVGFELRPELQQAHKQNMLAIDFDQEGMGRALDVLQSLGKFL